MGGSRKRGKKKKRGEVAKARRGARSLAQRCLEENGLSYVKWRNWGQFKGV